MLVGSQILDAGLAGVDFRDVPVGPAIGRRWGLGLLGVPDSASLRDLLSDLAPLHSTWLIVFDHRAMLEMAALTPPSVVVLHPRLAAELTPEQVGLLRRLCGWPILLIHVAGEISAATFGADGEVSFAPGPTGSAPDSAVALDAVLQLEGGPADRDGELRWDPLRLVLRSRSAYWRDRLLAASELQFRLLWALCQARGGVVSFAELSRAVYGDQGGADRGRLQAQVGRIRRLVELDPGQPDFLLTVRGRGFRLADR